MNNKKKLLSVSIISLLFLVVINFRTPFFTKQGGPWSIGYGISDNFPSKINPKKNNIYSINSLKEIDSSSIFLADPFFIHENDTTYLFYEHAIKKGNANISLMLSTDGINFNNKGIVLDEKFHLSYPYVFKHNNGFYMVPETKQARNILLYKAKNFPYDWEIIDTLIHNKQLKDPTIYLSDSLNILVASDDNLNMYMFNADSLRGNWKLNNKPIVLIGTEARPAGRFIEYGESLLLPVQNCSEGYGTGVSLYNLNFSKNTYKIEKYKSFFLRGNEKIKEFNKGMHHLDIQKIGNAYYFVYDGNSFDKKKYIFNWKGPLKWNFLDFKNWIYQNLN